MVDFGTKVLGTQNATLKIFPNLKTKSLQQEHSVSYMNWKCF